MARTRFKAPRLPAWRLAVAVLCLAAQAGMFVHLVLVRHQTCLEHASLGHGKRGTGVDARSEGAPKQTRLSGRPAAQHADDHCLALAFRKRDGLLAPVVLALAPPTAGLVPRVSGATAHRGPRPVALLRLAPKASPPPVAV